jgi:hypothetical protein
MIGQFHLSVRLPFSYSADPAARDRTLVVVVVEDIKIMAASFSSVTFRHVGRLIQHKLWFIELKRLVVISFVIWFRFGSGTNFVLTIFDQ